MHRGRANVAEILDSYEQERIGYAQALVATTDRAFTTIVAEGLRGELTRRVLAPLLLTLGTGPRPHQARLVSTSSRKCKSTIPIPC